MKLIIPENPQKYNWGQTNPLKTINPCPLPTSKKHLGKSRGLMAFDLMKTCKKSRFPVEITQKEIQECNRPSFDHPKILHILIDRAAGYGCKKLAKAHGGNHQSISKFTQSMGFGVIKGSDRVDVQWAGCAERLSDEVVAERAMEAERLSDLKSIAKYDETRHWGSQDHPCTNAWKIQKRWRTDEEYRNSRLAANISDEERKKRSEYSKQYAINNRNKIAEYSKKYSRENRDKFREYDKKRREDPIQRMKDNARKRSRQYIKTPGLRWSGFGCTSDEYRAHMESQFTKGMTWDNYGTYWHDDHIRPMASFDWNDPDQRRQCEHYTNKQPLEAKKNIKKSDKWDNQTTMFYGLA